VFITLTEHSEKLIRHHKIECWVSGILEFMNKSIRIFRVFCSKIFSAIFFDPPAKFPIILRHGSWISFLFTTTNSSIFGRHPVWRIKF
jgi:hypothetical protein